MILPFLLVIPFIAGIICLASRQRRVMDAVTVLSGLALLITGSIIAVQILNHGPVSSFGRFFYADSLSAVVILVIVVVAFTTSIFSTGYMRYQKTETVLGPRPLEGYYVLYHAFLIAMLLVPISNNLGIMWMAVEATTLASALLVALYGTVESLEAAWKYIIIGSVGIALALFGTVLVYYAGIHALGQGNYDLNWTTLEPVGHRLNPSIMKLVFIFALIGYGTKAGLAPMHTWLPDAHSEAPVPVSALLSGVLLNLALYAILRYYALAVRALGHAYPRHLLLAFGVFSIFVATLFIVRQADYKRLLAYSSVEHIGIIACGFAFGGPLATYGALLQMLNHAVVKSLMFFAVGNVLLKYRSKGIADISGLLRVSPLTAGVLILGGFALTGSPPFNTFVSEVAILWGGLETGNGLAAIIIIGLLAIIFIGFLQYVNSMVFGMPPSGQEPSRTNPWIAAAFAFSLAPILVLGFYVPSALDHLIRHAVTTVSAP
ncbi:MAG: hydrogenase 4 subunit F [Chloroflexota bacterium]|nr:MAG: hydrogenase 4 subunit F [Chloroflexota bacterium]